MLAYFAIAVLGIFAVGPLHNEGGTKCVEAKGVKECVNNAVAHSKKLDYRKLNNK